MGEAKRKRLLDWDGKETDPSVPNPYRDGEKAIEDNIYRDTVEALTALRDDVDNLNKRFRNSLFKDRILAGDEVCTVDVNGLRYGYKLVDLGMTMKRIILMKPINGRLSEFSEEDRRKTVVPIFEVFLKEGYTDITINCKRGCLEITQEFAIGFIVNRNPNLVSIVGGFNA